MPQSFPSQGKPLITSANLQSRSEEVTTLYFLSLTLDFIVDLLHKGDIWITECCYIQTQHMLRAISDIVHVHHSCGGKRGKLPRPVFRPYSDSHQYRFQIRLRLVDISAFSGQNKVTKMCPKYLLARYYK